jgi:PAS domain S-box-containing protein
MTKKGEIKTGEKKKIRILHEEEKQQLTQFYIDRVSDSVFWIGPDADILYVNQAACRILGYESKELLTMTVFDIDPDFNAKMWTEHWKEIRQHGTYTLKSHLRTKKGRVFPVEITVNHLEFNNREYNCAYARDISHREMVENALRESEGKFRLLSDQGLLAMVIIQDSIIKYAKPAAAELLEYSADELLVWKENEFAKLIHPEDRPFVVKQAQKKQAGETDVVTRYSYRIISKSGKTKRIDQYSKTVQYEGRNADFVSFMEITGRKQAEEILNKAHKELELLVEERTVELTEANRQLRRRIYDLYTIFELSRNFNAVLNYETLLDSFALTSLGQMGAAKAALYLPEEAGKKKFHQVRIKGAPPFPEKEILIDPEGEFGRYVAAYNRPVFISNLKNKFHDMEDLNFEKYFKKGLIIPLIFQTKLRGLLIISGKESGQPFRDEDIEFLSILANQTAVSIENARLYESEKDALEKLHKIQRLLLQTERLAVLGELSAKVAHEVNNPLGIIKNYLQLLSQIATKKGKDSEYIDVIRQEIDRITIIIKQLLDMARPMRIKFARVNLAKLLQEVITLMTYQLKSANVSIALQTEYPLPEILAWADGLKQVFMNLIINAKNVMPDGGQIKIKTFSGNHTIRVIIEDTGPGIKPEHIPHIFESFYTTREVDTGTGLGLSVCHGIIKNHNGIIDFQNTDKGGRFQIELPIEQEEIEHEWQI